MIKVKVYRNLKHGRKAKPLYSIMHNGKVIDRRHHVLLTDATFVVSEAGRQRVLREGRNNVHAFVIGTLAESAMGIDARGKDLPIHVYYNPYECPDFFMLTPEKKSIATARCVLLNEHGMTAAYVEAK